MRKLIAICAFALACCPLVDAQGPKCVNSNSLGCLIPNVFGRNGLTLPNEFHEAHFENDFLANFTPLNNVFGSGENLHLVERFTRTGPSIIDYTITLEDPTAWTRPWTAAVPLKRTSQQIYEVACHEGDYAIIGILKGARAEEQR